MIIKSILDTDLYKFTTSYAYMKLFPQARGTFEFIDRDNTEYPEDFIERLYLELGSLGMLHLAKDEQEYMNNNCRFIPPVYWEWLSSFKFNSGKIQASLDENGHLHIKVTDYLYKVTLYEVPILAIVSELRSRIFDNNCDLAEILEELLPKEPTKEELNAALLKLALDKGWYDDNEEHDIHPVQIPKNQMGIAVKELKAKYPAADGKKIADLVKANLCN